MAMMEWEPPIASLRLPLPPRPWGMVPTGLLLALWIGWGCTLGLLAGLAWLDAARIHGLLAGLQAWYGVGTNPSLPLRADFHLHIITSLLVVLWLGLGTRLFAPRMLPWLPVALFAPIAIADELAQLGSADRSFEWGDQIGDLVGVAIAIPLLLLLRHLRVAGRRATTRPPAPVRPPIGGNQN